VETSYSNQQATLRIRVALPEDSGHYTLLSENPQGCTVSSAYLAIESSDQVDQVSYQAHPREFMKTQQVESTIESTDTLARFYHRILFVPSQIRKLPKAK